MKKIVSGTDTPYGVGLWQDGYIITPYGRCCGSMLLRATSGTTSRITCTCGRINVPPNYFTITLNLNEAAPGVWPQWVAAFTGFDSRDIKVSIK